MREFKSEKDQFSGPWTESEQLASISQSTGWSPTSVLKRQIKRERETLKKGGEKGKRFFENAVKWAKSNNGEKGGEEESWVLRQKRKQISKFTPCVVISEKRFCFCRSAKKASFLTVRTIHCYNKPFWRPSPYAINRNKEKRISMSILVVYYLLVNRKAATLRPLLTTLAGPYV